MTEPDLTTVLEEAEHVAEQHDQVARTTDNQAHEYLRYAVLRVLEGETDQLPADWTPIDGVTVGYGSDDAMFDSWGPAKTGGRMSRHRRRVPALGCSSRTTTRRFHVISST